MHPYDEFCDFDWEHVSPHVDFFVFFHAIGWFLFSFVIRNRLMLHSLSVLDEIIGTNILFFFMLILDQYSRH